MDIRNIMTYFGVTRTSAKILELLAMHRFVSAQMIEYTCTKDAKAAVYRLRRQLDKLFENNWVDVKFSRDVGYWLVDWQRRDLYRILTGNEHAELPLDHGGNVSGVEGSSPAVSS